MIDKNFWQGKRVFVTGHTGFKGSWLCLWLSQLGATIKGYALKAPTSPSIFEVANVEQCLESEIADIRDLQSLRNSIEVFQPDIVFHMAAQPLVRLSYDIPVETYETNVMGTVNLLEAVRHVSSVKAVVNITSDKCYENQEWPWGYRENEAKGGHDPYSNSKGCAELVADAFRKSYFGLDSQCALASARAGNVIGGGDWAKDRLIPDILTAFEKKEKVQVRNPSSIRPWQHVLEPLSGYLLCAQYLALQGKKFAEGWNFGSEDSDAKPVEWILVNMCKLWGEGADWEQELGNHPHEAHYLKLDCSKAKMRMGWRPRWSLNEALQRIVNWQKSYMNDADMHEYSLNEISEYMNNKTISE